jgi:[NiFe] hydrogenase assembly HybE family chaperone
MKATQQKRGAALELLFNKIACTRMRDVPVQNPAVRVQAIGFAPAPDEPGILLGVLVTPWFMNLVRLPAQACLPGATLLTTGNKGNRAVGPQSFEFVGAFEPDMGAFEVCSLFSPMFEFANHAAAADTANEILRLLRTPVTSTPSTAETLPSRRGFLFGRGTQAVQPQA